MSATASPLVVLTGPDRAALDALRPAGETLDFFGITHVEVTPPGALDGEPFAVIVASPDNMLPAALAATTAAPVIRVPAPAHGSPPGLHLLTAPAGQGAAFATVAIGAAGARNAALLVVSIMALRDDRLRQAWDAFRQEQTGAVLRQPTPWTPS